MATFKVYKFRGQDFSAFFKADLLARDSTPISLLWQVRFSVMGDLYLGEDEEKDGYDLCKYLLRCYYVAFVARYDGRALSGAYYRDDGSIQLFGPPVSDKVETSTYVEPTSGSVEVVYRRCRLDGSGTLIFYLSPSPELADGEAHLGSLVRPAPRTLFSDEVAEKFRTSDPAGPCGCK
jgi:hypothetical protein